MEGLIFEILRYFPQNWGLKSNVTFWGLWCWLCINTNTKNISYWLYKEGLNYNKLQ